MANYIGDLIPNFINFNSNLTPTWIETGIPFITTGSYYNSVNTFNGVVSKAGVITPIVKNVSGDLTESYFNIFYNRLLIEPIEINLGNVASPKSESVKI